MVARLAVLDLADLTHKLQMQIPLPAPLLAREVAGPAVQAVQAEAGLEVAAREDPAEAVAQIFEVEVRAAEVVEARVAEAEAGARHKARRPFTARNAYSASAPTKFTSAYTISMATQLSMPSPIR